ncbi:MAG: hypothetical protein ABIJ56_07575 [Pseudomonadota bacterium]
MFRLPILFLFCLLAMQLAACELLVDLRKERLPELDAADDAAEISPEVDGEVDGEDARDTLEEEIYCDDNEDCDDGRACTDDQCELTEHRCSHFLSTEDTVCRPSAGDCDTAETCDGASADCPADKTRADGAVCDLDPRSICLQGSCEESECGDGFVDTGGGESCEPPFAGDCDGDCHSACGLADDECPDDGNACNGEEFCDVGPGTCASRDPLDDGTECGEDPRMICIARSCQESICGDGFRDEVDDEECDDANDESGDGCENDCTWSCHEHADCDDGHACTEDLCDMEGTHACTNQLSPDSAVCRPAGGMCDVAEFCTGSDEDCPADARKGGETVCREAAGVCDVPEHCAGDVSCPEDTYKSGDICRPTAGVCDALESCQGDSPDCPANSYKGSAFECRPAAFACDAAEVCSGSSTACPADAILGEGAECSDGDPCTMNDRCDPEGECMGDPGGLLTGVVASAGGTGHTCALDDRGAVSCWGSNLLGQLGNGDSEDSFIPVQVEGLESGVAEIAAGNNHACALMSSGSVKCWGGGSAGQLGNGSTDNRRMPVDVTGIIGGATALTAGGEFTCAILAMGGLRCWGKNSQGQLGDSSVISKLTPTDVSGMSSGVTAVSAGREHACAVRSGGLKCWGYNTYGQVGDGSTTMRLAPVDVSGLTSGVSDVSCGGEHTCAITIAGALKCWGFNAYGQIGDGTILTKLSPVDVIGMEADMAEAVDAGEQHTCARQAGGGALCWGSNGSGELGDGTRVERREPAPVPGMDAAAHVMAGHYQTCMTLEGGVLMCWGDNAEGELGRGRKAIVARPMRVGGIDGGAEWPAGGASHACLAIAGTGALCWGDNLQGELGNGSEMLSAGPSAVMGLDLHLRQVDAGTHFSCALADTGGVLCWGINDRGQLGDGTTDTKRNPVNVAGLEENVEYIACGAKHACAILNTGQVRCWGDNTSSQLGGSELPFSPTPLDLEGLDERPIVLSAGATHTCAAVESTGVWCWGGNARGQLGNGSTADSGSPVEAVGISENVISLAAGGEHTCCIDRSQAAMCWGANNRGQIGDNTVIDKLTPAGVDGMSSEAEHIVAGYEHTCATLAGGSLKCWGSNFQGQLGVGLGSYSRVPLLVSSLIEPVRFPAAGDYHTCAILGPGTVYCWGDDTYGAVSGVFSGYPFPVGCRP